MKRGGREKRSPKTLAAARTETTSGPVTTSGRGGVSHSASDRKAYELASPCHRALTWEARKSIGSPAWTFRARSTSVP